MKQAWLGTIATNGAILVSGIATGVLAARLLGPEERGLLAAIIFWPQMTAALAALSLGEALIARWNRSAVGPERLVVSACVAALALAFAAIVPGILLLPWLLGPQRTHAVALAQGYLVAYLPFGAIGMVLGAYDHAARRFVRLNLLRLGPSSIYLAGIGVLWFTDAVGVGTLLWATWVGLALTVAAHVCFTVPALLARPSTAELRTLLSLGARFHAGAFLSLLANQVDRILLFRLFDDVAASHYVVAGSFASSGLTVATSAVVFVLQPTLASERDRSRARRLLTVALRRMALFLYVGVVGSVAVTPWLLPLLFGRAFAEAVPLAILLLLAVVPFTLRQAIVRCLRAFGEARVGVTSELATLAGFLLICPALLGIGLGAEGLAAASILANAAGLAVTARYLWDRHAIATRAWLLPGPSMFRDGLVFATRLIKPVMAR